MDGTQRIDHPNGATYRLEVPARSGAPYVLEVHLFDDGASEDFSASRSNRRVAEPPAYIDTKLTEFLTYCLSIHAGTAWRRGHAVESIMDQTTMLDTIGDRAVARNVDPAVVAEIVAELVSTHQLALQAQLDQEREEHRKEVDKLTEQISTLEEKDEDEDEDEENSEEEIQAGLSEFVHRLRWNLTEHDFDTHTRTAVLEELAPVTEHTEYGADTTVLI